MAKTSVTLDESASTKPTPVPPPVGDPVPVTVLDIPAGEPYPTGSPQEPSYTEINDLPKGA